METNDDDEKECKICYEKNSKSVLKSYLDNPSDYEEHKLHHYMCQKCYLELDKCPYCNKKFKKTKSQKIQDHIFQIVEEKKSAKLSKKELSEEIGKEISQKTMLDLMFGFIKNYREEHKLKDFGRGTESLANYIFTQNLDPYCKDDEEKIDYFKNRVLVYNILQNLEKRPELNGKECHVLATLPNGRLKVQIFGEKPFSVSKEKVNTKKFPGLTDEEYKDLKQYYGFIRFLNDSENKKYNNIKNIQDYISNSKIRYNLIKWILGGALSQDKQKKIFKDELLKYLSTQTLKSEYEETFLAKFKVSDGYKRKLKSRRRSKKVRKSNKKVRKSKSKRK